MSVKEGGRPALERRTADAKFPKPTSKSPLDVSRMRDSRPCVKRAQPRPAFRGVYQRRNVFKATISDGPHRTRHLGYFPTAVEAAQAYDAAARERYGDDAVLNFPDGES